ncbi:DUF2478 domain-containing protein [Caenispirillum salinarum]|uniref:DUF2478 domain-containing protein n=1 Tax=Caenispirillum salinarum TaxID=859058 RepID=UPI00384F2B67
MTQDPPLRIGVVVHQRGDNAEDVLAAFLDELRGRPVRVGGLYQQTVRTASGPNVMDVVDIQTAARIRISQPLGGGSSSCCLDPAGLADAAAHLRRVRESGVDLLVVNKFAGAEAEGEGLAEEMFAALCEGVPVLVLVSARYLDAWDAATDSAGERLPPTLAALWAWYRRLGLEAADAESGTPAGVPAS